MLIKLLLKKDKEALLQYFRNIIEKKYSMDEIYKHGDNLLYPWMKDALSVCMTTPEKICDQERIYGLKYGDLEFSNSYSFLYGVRISNAYSLKPTGIYKKNKLICQTPIYPVGSLIIGCGKYPSYYKIKNLLVEDYYVSDITDIKKISIDKQEIIRYINSCVYLNSLPPRTIKISTYH